MLVAKRKKFEWIAFLKFENYVNYAGSKTNQISEAVQGRFENYVNYAG
ncbi:hypothetical protein HMPREF9430_02068, partial [Solobacterium moorei F0204]